MAPTRAPEGLLDKERDDWEAIEEGLKEYSERPRPVSFTKVYTGVYNLSQKKKGKLGVCQKLYRRYREETAFCAQHLLTSADEALARPGLPLSQRLAEVADSWHRIRRRLYVLQRGFQHLDRYFVKEGHLTTLSDIVCEEFGKAEIQEAARAMWRDLAAAIAEAGAAAPRELVRDVIVAWQGIGPCDAPSEDGDGLLAGPEGGVAAVLRAHTAQTWHHLSPSRPFTATHRVWRQQPLLRLISDFLPEEPLCRAYGLDVAVTRPGQLGGGAAPVAPQDKDVSGPPGAKAEDPVEARDLQDERARRWAVGCCHRRSGPAPAATGRHLER